MVGIINESFIDERTPGLTSQSKEDGLNQTGCGMRLGLRIFPGASRFALERRHSSTACR
jgi:hypothetical protein